MTSNKLKATTPHQAARLRYVTAEWKYYALFFLLQRIATPLNF